MSDNVKKEIPKLKVECNLTCQGIYALPKLILISVAVPLGNKKNDSISKICETAVCRNAALMQIPIFKFA